MMDFLASHLLPFSLESNTDGLFIRVPWGHLQVSLGQSSFGLEVPKAVSASGTFPSLGGKYRFSAEMLEKDSSVECCEAVFLWLLCQDVVPAGPICIPNTGPICLITTVTLLRMKQMRASLEAGFLPASRALSYNPTDCQPFRTKTQPQED